MHSLDTSEQAAAVQLAAYRRMTPAARLRVAMELTELSRQLLMEGIRRRHRNYDPEQVRLAMIRVWLGANLFKRAYPNAPELEA